MVDGVPSEKSGTFKSNDLWQNYLVLIISTENIRIMCVSEPFKAINWPVISVSTVRLQNTLFLRLGQIRTQAGANHCPETGHFANLKISRMVDGVPSEKN